MRFFGLALLVGLCAHPALGAAPPLGDTFYWQRGNLTFEEFLKGLEGCNEEGNVWRGDCIIKVSLKDYAALLRREGHDVTAENLADWLRQNGEVRPCEGQVEQHLFPSDERLTSATQKRPCRPGEQLVYVGNRPVLSLNCGNPVVSDKPPPAPKPKPPHTTVGECSWQSVPTVADYGSGFYAQIPSAGTASTAVAAASGAAAVVGSSIFSGGPGYGYSSAITINGNQVAGPACNLN